MSEAIVFVGGNKIIQRTDDRHFFIDTPRPSLHFVSGNKTDFCILGAGSTGIIRASGVERPAGAVYASFYYNSKKPFYKLIVPDNYDAFVTNYTDHAWTAQVVKGNWFEELRIGLDITIYVSS